ncbi:MmgE/PrpD family protein [Cupriavidus consociatus]|uniref:MmgE/PrpD family protein n=1 Tax=Cupriavidus consociatus TaxID=2821357 RepID=UPI001AE7C9B8|nr:MmgE/PrpD family protein [Cupriavidus sp. LEh21]MBP0625309.1 MmgE/PrpD family protein [Cupriavidus sp. LEh25]MDK2662045.1 MmgE/PrpD family protein [Cupriavidus sp. LEh21]
MNEIRYSTVERLARYVCDLRPTDISDTVKDRAAMCILDTLAAAAAGVHVPSVVAARQASVELFGKGDVAIWFDGRRTTAAGAIFANSSAAAVLDMDDGHREARGHPAAAIVPAVLAFAAEIGSSADDALSAIAIGYEVGIRIKTGRGDHGQKGAHGQTGVWAGFGVSAALCWLRRASHDQLANSLALAGVFSPNLIATAYTSQLGADVKEGIPWSAVTGYTSFMLANFGHAGFNDILDHSPFYDSEHILRGLGEGEMKIKGNYFKPYATCRHFHPALKALETLIKKHDIQPSDIIEIKVYIYDYALRLSNKTRPENLTDIQYSIPYSMAVMAILGSDAFLPIDESLLDRPDLCALAEKVEILVDPEYSALFPQLQRNRVEVVTACGAYSSPATSAPWDQDEPMSMKILGRKFRRASANTLNHSQQDDVLRAVEDLVRGEITPLLEVMASPTAISL